LLTNHAYSDISEDRIDHILEIRVVVVCLGFVDDLIVPDLHIQMTSVKCAPKKDYFLQFFPWIVMFQFELCNNRKYLYGVKLLAHDTEEDNQACGIC
jgi:hypothetical protein